MKRRMMALLLCLLMFVQLMPFTAVAEEAVPSQPEQVLTEGTDAEAAPAEPADSEAADTDPTQSGEAEDTAPAEDAGEAETAEPENPEAEQETEGEADAVTPEGPETPEDAEAEDAEAEEGEAEEEETEETEEPEEAEAEEAELAYNILGGRVNGKYITVSGTMSMDSELNAAAGSEDKQQIVTEQLMEPEANGNYVGYSFDISIDGEFEGPVTLNVSNIPSAGSGEIIKVVHLLDSEEAIAEAKARGTARSYTAPALANVFSEETAAASRTTIYYELLDATRSGSNIVFRTTSFSEFIVYTYTVDFHYNDIDFSIPGGSGILLSELFQELKIDEDVSLVTNVTFSDTELVSVTRENGDWRLTSLKAFQTEETLIITFEDEHTIIIDVTDAQSLTNAKELSGDTILFFADVADQYGINATITDTWGLKSGTWYLQIDGVQKSTSKATMTYSSNHFGIRSDYYWFEVSGASGNTSYKSGDVASFKFDALPGSVSITYNAHSNLVYNNTSYCQVRQQSQAVYAGHTDTRCVKIYADGTFVQEVWPVMPSRDKGRGYSASDIYVDALYGPYYTYSVSVENNTYIVRLYSRYTVSGSVADSKGTASPASQTVTYGNSGSITFAASTGYVIDYVMDGSTMVEVSDADSYTYTVSNVTSSRSVVAYTKVKTFTVSYSSNGGSGTTAAQTFNYGSSVALRANGFTAPNGNQFLGWYSSADKTVYAAGATYALNESTTMTALWGKTDANGSWNNSYYILPGTTSSNFSSALKHIDVDRADYGLTSDSNTYYVAPGAVISLAHDADTTADFWRIDGAESGLTLSAGGTVGSSAWNSSAAATLTVSSSAAVGTTMMIYTRDAAEPTEVSCARVIVQTPEQITKWTINDTKNSADIYTVGVFIILDSTDIPGEPKYTQGVAMTNIANFNNANGLDYAYSANGFVTEDIASSARYRPSIDGTCTMGVVDYTGHQTLPYIQSISEDAMDTVLAQIKADSNTFYAADGTNLNDYYKQNGEAALRENFEVRPHIVKLMTGLSHVDLGWHIDCSIYDVDTISITYNLNFPEGYVNNTLGTPDPTLAKYSGNAVIAQVTTDVQDNTKHTVSVTGSTDTAELTFTGWNDEPNGSGTHYDPGANISLTDSVTLYGEWTGGNFTTGTLEVYKEVTVQSGSLEPGDDTFNFNVNLSGSRAYTVFSSLSGARLSTGTMTNGTFSLKAGQFIRFTGVPVGTYTVTETLPANYSNAAATQTVTLQGGYTNNLHFVNHYSNIPNYTVTGTITNGTVTNGNQSVKRGDSSAAMTFTPDAGYEISGITVNGTAQQVSSKTSYTYPAQTNVTDDITVVVTTKQITYKVTGTIDHGTVTNDDQTVNYGGSSAAMIFTPNAGYEISGITVNGTAQQVSSKTSYTYPVQTNVTEDIAVVVTTKPITYKVTGTIDNGTVTNDDQSVNYGGSSEAMTFTPAEGYKITGIKVNGTAQTVSDETSYTYPAQNDVKQDITVEVTTQLRVYKVTGTIDNGTVDNGSQSISHGGSSTAMTFKPKTGYKIVSATENGKALTVTNEDAFVYESQSSVSGDIAVVVTTALKQFTLTTSADENSTILSGATYTYSDTETTKVTFSANENYEIESVLVDGEALTGEALAQAIADGYVIVDHKSNHSIAVTAKASIASYTIEVYKQELEGDGYKKTMSITKSGLIGAVAEIDEQYYNETGFTVDHEKSKESGTITADGKLVLALYFNRIPVKVSYSYTGTIPSGAPKAPETVIYHYGATVTVEKAPEMEGYTFSGWSKTGTFEATEDTTITGSWTANEDAWYLVHYYLKDNTVLQDDKEVKKLPFGQSYEETAPAIPGFKPVGEETQSVTAGYQDNEITFYYEPVVSNVKIVMHVDGKYANLKLPFTGTLNWDHYEGSPQTTDSAAYSLKNGESTDGITIQAGSTFHLSDMMLPDNYAFVRAEYKNVKATDMQNGAVEDDGFVLTEGDCELHIYYKSKDVTETGLYLGNAGAIAAILAVCAGLIVIYVIGRRRRRNED